MQIIRIIYIKSNIIVTHKNIPITTKEALWCLLVLNLNAYLYIKDDAIIWILCNLKSIVGERLELIKGTKLALKITL